MDFFGFRVKNYDPSLAHTFVGLDFFSAGRIRSAGSGDPRLPTSPNSKVAPCPSLCNYFLVFDIILIGRTLYNLNKPFFWNKIWRLNEQSLLDEESRNNRAPTLISTKLTAWYIYRVYAPFVPSRFLTLYAREYEHLLLIAWLTLQIMSACLHKCQLIKKRKRT